MIKQNHPQLNKAIQAYGCNFLAHLAMHKEDWSAQEVMAIYEQALALGIIDQECSVKHPQALLELIGSPLRQIGGIDLLQGQAWGVKELDRRIQRKIARWEQRHRQAFHFTLCNTLGEYYDPYDARLASYSLERKQLLGYQFYG